MTTIDLGIAWEWEYDVDFVFELDRSCQRAGLTSYLVYPGNLMETWEKGQNGSLGFRIELRTTLKRLSAWHGTSKRKG